MGSLPRSICPHFVFWWLKNQSIDRSINQSKTALCSEGKAREECRELAASRKKAPLGGVRTVSSWLMLCLFFKHQTLFTYFEASGISAEFWGKGTGQFPGASHDSLLQRRLGLGGCRARGGSPTLRPSVPRGGRPGGQWPRRTGPRLADTPRTGIWRTGWPWW